LSLPSSLSFTSSSSFTNSLPSVFRFPSSLLRYGLFLWHFSFTADAF
jgi:hypothetical protein